MTVSPSSDGSPFFHSQEAAFQFTVTVSPSTDDSPFSFLLHSQEAAFQFTVTVSEVAMLQTLIEEVGRVGSVVKVS